MAFYLVLLEEQLESLHLTPPEDQIKAVHVLLLSCREWAAHIVSMAQHLASLKVNSVDCKANQELNTVDCKDNQELLLTTL